MHRNSNNSTIAEEHSITELFFSLIRCGIGNEKQLPYPPTAEQWNELFTIAKKQTLAGIAFAGIVETGGKKDMEGLSLKYRPERSV